MIAFALLVADPVTPSATGATPPKSPLPEAVVAAEPPPTEDEVRGRPSPATQEERQKARARVGDTTYGRIEGDISLVLGAGVSFTPRAPMGTFDFRARYLQTIGLYVDYADGFGNAAEPKRMLSTGLEVRPLFLARWLQGWESGRSRLDLAVDSLGITLGAVFAQPTGQSFASRPGLEAALGVDLPITGRATGVWLDVRAGARWSDAELGGTSTAAANNADDRSLFCTLTLAWHQGFAAHVVDEGDRAPK